MASRLHIRQNGASTSPALEHLSAPYPPTHASLGGFPKIIPDIPITTVFLVLFIIGAVGHMAILRNNQSRGHKFLMSGMMFGFCMSRIVTMILRIAWTCNVENVRLAIAANIFVYAGVVLLFVVNTLFAQRILRAQHPNSGWSSVVHFAFLGVYILIVLSLIMLIVSVIQSFYTLNAYTLHVDRAIQLYGQTFYAAIAFIPIPLTIISSLVPRTNPRVEKFGTGRFRVKIGILLVASFLLCLGAAYRAGANYAGGTLPINHPAKYQSKACFYIFNFTVEIIVILLYVVARVDQRFHVPDHSKGPGDYSRANEVLEKTSEEGPLERHIDPEEEKCDDSGPETLATGKDVEKGATEGTPSARMTQESH